MTQPLILHIDDSELVLQIVGRGLQQAGFRVVSVSDFSRLPQALTGSGLPDLILLDIRMPGVEGDDLAVFFKRQWRLEIPIVLFSDLPADEIRKRVKSAGANAGVRKHDGLPTLIRMIRGLLPAPARPAAAARPEAGSPQPLTTQVRVDTSVSVAVAGNGNGASPAADSPPITRPADFPSDVDAWAARVRHLLGGDLSAEGWRRRLPDVRDELGWLREEAAERGSPLARRLARAAAKAFSNPDSVDPGAREVLAAFIPIMIEVVHGETRRGEALLSLLRGGR